MDDLVTLPLLLYRVGEKEYMVFSTYLRQIEIYLHNFWHESVQKIPLNKTASDFFLYITVSLYNADVITTSSKMPL